MTVISTSLTLPAPPDQVVIATQDIIDQRGWRVHAISATEIVFQEHDNNFISAVLPKIVATLKPLGEGTEVNIVCSITFPPGPLQKKRAAAFVGEFVNAISLRIQTNSVAINPTVQIGEGQTGGTPLLNDRYQQLRRAKDLLDSGVLTQQEFESEKARILAE